MDPSGVQSARQTSLAEKKRRMLSSPQQQQVSPVKVRNSPQKGGQLDLAPPPPFKSSSLLKHSEYTNTSIQSEIVY